MVIGAGAAGLTAALEIRPRQGKVVLLTKAELGGGCASAWAQGGIAAAVGGDDAPSLHAADTLFCGAGLSDPRTVELLTRDAPSRIRKLVKLGARFDHDSSGLLQLGREGAHSRRRILHARDATGAEIIRVLSGAVRRSSRIEVVEKAFALDLSLASEGLQGVAAQHADGSRMLFLTPCVILASGGAGRLYLRTTNPPQSTADGLAIAARAGACLADLEFVQFHPTALDVGADPLPLVTEALRGEGAVLVEEGGRPFMRDEHQLADLAPRDIVAQAIWRRLQDGQRVFLDATRAVGDGFPARFPTVFEHCRRAGVDPRLQPIPVTPAAHYHIGGVAVDSAGRTSVPGLWACGETAAAGVHGANRLASNSLLEAIVFGRRVAADVNRGRPWQRSSDLRQALNGLPPDVWPPASQQAPDWRGDSDQVEGLRRLMWEKAGLLREASELRRALNQLDLWRKRPLWGESRNLMEAAWLLVRSALQRQESRGVHQRTDFPQADPRWRKRIFLAPGQPCSPPAAAGAAS